MLENPEIKLLVTGCVKKDPTSQKELVNTFSSMLYTVCLRYMGESHLAKDVLQDSFIRIFKGIHTYDSERGSLQGWMRRVTINVALKQLKKQKSRMESEIGENVSHLTKDANVTDKLAAEDLLKVVQTLPDGYRQIFNLSVVEGYNHREIGEMLGIEEVTSRSQLSRAKQLLRKKLINMQTDESWAKIS